MKTICLNELSWISYARLCTMISACIGFALSILLLLLHYIVHIDLSIHFGSLYVDGELFCIVSAFVAPFVGATIGLLGSLCTYHLFSLMLGWFYGVRLTGKWLDSEHCRAIE